MGAMDFYKRDPNAALTGMRGLPSDEYKGYGIILDLIYSMDNRVPDDDGFVAGWCGFRVSLWKKVKSALIAKEKIYVEDGFIRNVKADEVIEKATESSKIVSKINSIKGKKSAAARNKNKKLAEPTVNHLESESESESDKKEENNPTLLPDLPEQDISEKAVEGWNELVDWQTSQEKPDTSPPRIPKIQHLTDKRKSALRLRWHDIGGFPGWARLLEIIKQSPHLLGQNDRGWTVTFDWVLNPTNLTKIMEGNYVRKQSGNSKAGGTKDALDWLHSEAERREGLASGDDSDGGKPEP